MMNHVQQVLVVVIIYFVKLDLKNVDGSKIMVMVVVHLLHANQVMLHSLFFYIFFDDFLAGLSCQPVKQIWGNL